MKEYKLHEVANADRLEKKMSIKEVIQLSGVKKSTVYNFFNGKAENMSMTKFWSIIKAIKNY